MCVCMGNVKVCANKCTLDYNNNISNNNCNCKSRFGLRSQPLAAITTIITTTNTQNAAHLSGLAAATTTQVKQKTKKKLKIHKQFRSRLCQLQAPSPSARCSPAGSLTLSQSLLLVFYNTACRPDSAHTAVALCSAAEGSPSLPPLYNALT